MLPAEERTSWLARACGDDATLRREVEELLHADAAQGVLDTPPFAAGGEELAAVAPSLAAETRVGAWRIEKLIGRGGMGEVYAATRAEAAFTQRGALKLLRFEAIGELARFHAERQILARLDHPGIARLLDGGVAQDGRPYTVMEYVAGVSLIAHCAARNAPLHERLELFAQVCDAVAYAHRNLVVHRDLKPANTLVDAEGKVKLLDFGIAKLLDAGAVKDAANATLTLAPFTPDYAAPEQLAGEAVTTATDTYALGVLLFELLTGERPFRMDGLQFAKALALLNDRTAPPPSRVARERTTAPLPANALTGDLDAIVAKCLRREPMQRYATVNDLQLDLQRHLAREPVLAREGARLYVFGRVLRRYRWGVAAAAALILALGIGIAATAWQAHRAQAQAARAEAVKNFLVDVFKASDPRIASDKPRGSITARELLDVASTRIDAGFADQPETKTELLGIAADLLCELSPGGDERDKEECVALRGKYLDAVGTLLGEAHPQLADATVTAAYEASILKDKKESVALLDRADALIRRANLEETTTRARWHAARAAAATSAAADYEPQLQRAAQLYERLGADDSLYVDTLIMLGSFYSAGTRRNLDTARDYYLRARDAERRLPAPDGNAAIIEYNLANNADMRGDAAAAAQGFERAANEYLRTYGDKEPWYWATLAGWGGALCRQGDFAGAQRIFERMQRALPVAADPTYENEHLQIARAQFSYGYCLLAVGRAQDAIVPLQAAVRGHLDSANQHSRETSARLALGKAFALSGRFDEARRILKDVLDEELRSDPASAPADRRIVLRAREQWGWFLIDRGEMHEAEMQFREVVALDHGHNFDATASAEAGLATVALRRDDASAALVASTAALNIRDAMIDKYDRRLEARLWCIHAQALARNGDFAHARDYAQRAFDAFTRLDVAQSPEIAESRVVLAAIDRAAKN